jgi:hypothetical protein
VVLKEINKFMRQVSRTRLRVKEDEKIRNRG